MSGRRTVTIHYRRPPGKTQDFHQEILEEREDVVVTLLREMSFSPPMRIDDEVVLEDGSSVVWFTFPGAWHDIGRFHRADGTFTGFYANILTPVEMEPGEAGEDEWWTTDLFLDVWLPPGGEPRVLDEEELDEAVGRELVEPAVADRARLEAEGLVAAARKGDWPPAVVHEWTLDRALGS